MDGGRWRARHRPPSIVYRLVYSAPMKVALVHDWLNQYGGAELVLEALHDLFPEAPIFTSMYWPEKMPAAYARWDIRVSFLDRLPLVKTHHQPFLGLYPLAFELHDLS